MSKITDLPSLPAAADTDLIWVVSGGTLTGATGTDYKATRLQLVNSVKSDLAAEIATTGTEIADLQNGKLALSGGTMTGALLLVGSPSEDLHATTKLYVDNKVGSYLPLAGGTLTGAIAMGTSRITGLGDPTAAQDAMTREFFDANGATNLEDYSLSGVTIYPTTWGSRAIRKGDRFRVSVAGTITYIATSYALEVGDVLEALVDNASADHADWVRMQTNILAASETDAGYVELATDAETATGTSTTHAITPANLAATVASDTQAGVIELATATEVLTGTDTTRAITPAGLSSQVTDYERFFGLQDILAYSAGTWTTTRVAQGDYVARKTAADDTTIIGIDITEAYRTTAARGYELNSFDVIYRNTTANLDAHSVTLDRMSYTDSGVVTTTSVAITGTLLLTQDADPRVTNITIDSPATLADGKYVIELTVDAAATSVYDFIGVNLKFHKTGI